MHVFANPARFLKIARPATAWRWRSALLLILAGVLGGLFVTPPDYLQGESVAYPLHPCSRRLARHGGVGRASPRPA